MLRLRTAPYVTLALLAAGCSAASVAYSPAVDNSISRLKSRTLRMMERGETPYQNHATALAKLMDDLEAARDFSIQTKRGRAAAQWDLLLAPDGHLFGGFVRRWRLEDTLRPTFVVESKDLISRAFDTLLAHERSRIGSPR